RICRTGKSMSSRRTSSGPIRICRRRRRRQRSELSRNIMRTLLVALAAGLGALIPATADACGACVEDKVAATYDHAVIDRAIASHRQVVFVAIEGPANPTKVVAQITAAAPKVRGVQPGSLRTSTSPPAFSFVLDNGQDPRAAVATLRRNVTGQETQFVAIRLVRDGLLRELD